MSIESELAGWSPEDAARLREIVQAEYPSAVAAIEAAEAALTLEGSSRYPPPDSIYDRLPALDAQLDALRVLADRIRDMVLLGEELRSLIHRYQPERRRMGRG